MAKIIFEDDGIEEPYEPDTPLADIVEACGADIIFGCREGGCATCIIEITEGMEHLSPHSMAEQSTLEEAELDAGKRLCCQVRLLSAGTVRVRSAGL
jgi:ferredoxin